MPTTREDIRKWIERRPEGCTHMLVVCDTFDYGDYPVYFPSKNKSGKTLAEVFEESDDRNKMSMVMEVYSFTGKHSIEDQLAAYRAKNFD